MKSGIEQLKRVPAWFATLFLATIATLGGEALQTGSVLRLESGTLKITRLQSSPLIQSEYTALFKFDSAENPKLRKLREHYRLEEVVASGRDEFEKQILLMDWVHHQFKKFGQPTMSAKGALEILQGIERGHTFFCTQYAQLFVSAAASLGWIDRPLALRRHQDSGRGGSTEHATTEIWSNQYAKWIMLDPTSNFYLEKNGVPLNAYEIRQEWFYNAGRDLVFVVGKERRKYTKKDLPIFLRKFAEFGDLTIDPEELDKYGFIGYIPNSDLMDSGFDYGRMFIVKDQLCDGTSWHQRRLPKNPATDPYFPIHQVTFVLEPSNDAVRVQLATFTPNLLEFQVSLNGAEWRRAADTFDWTPKAGINRLEARAVNAFGVSGPVAVIEALLVSR